MLQIGVVQGSIPLGISALSYSGQPNIVIVADADPIPDLEVFSGGLTETFERLQKGSPGALSASEYSEGNATGAGDRACSIKQGGDRAGVQAHSGRL